MRYLLPLVFILLLLAAQPLRAEYFLKGKVISVDREKGEITLAVLSARQCEAPCPAEQGGGQDDGSRSAQQELYVISAGFIPPCVATDAMISVWGELSGPGEKRLLARRIMGPGGGGRHGRDATGVRNRLRNRCWMQGGGAPGSGAPGAP